MGTAQPHEVLRVLAARTRADSQPLARDDGLRVVLAIEGGAMRGTVSGGMALGLHELGLVPAFDAVYGASAGAISGAWLLSSGPEGLRGWPEPAYARALIHRSALLRGRPVADVRMLIEEVYQTTFPMDFASVLASPVEYHPLATDAATGESADLRPLLAGPAELRLALRASAALPLLAGPPVEFGGRRYYDAGVSESVPYRTALAQGATHILVLRSRRDPRAAPDGRGPARSARLIARTALRRETLALRTAFLTREARLARDDELLASYQSAEAPPWVFSIRPPASSPEVSRLATDGPLLHAAFEAGRSATHSAFRRCELIGLPIYGQAGRSIRPGPPPSTPGGYLNTVIPPLRGREGAGYCPAMDNWPSWRPLASRKTMLALSKAGQRGEHLAVLLPEDDGLLG